MSIIVRGIQKILMIMNQNLMTQIYIEFAILK